MKESTIFGIQYYYTSIRLRSCISYSIIIIIYDIRVVFIVDVMTSVYATSTQARLGLIIPLSRAR